MAISVSTTAYGVGGSHGSYGARQIQRPVESHKPAVSAPAHAPAAPPVEHRTDKVTLSSSAAPAPAAPVVHASNSFEAIRTTSKVVKNDNLGPSLEPQRPTAREQLESQRRTATTDPGGQIGSRLNIMA